MVGLRNFFERACITANRPYAAAPSRPVATQREAQMRRHFTIAVLAAAATLLTAQPATAFVDRDCSDFPSWRAAQHYYHAHGGPRRDPSHLDADHDGIACEDLR